jgi:hypothetical protein
VPGQAQQLNQRIRDVLARAQLEDGLSAAETARKAQAGELEGLPPTRMSETLCRNVANEAKRRAGGRRTPASAGENSAPVDQLAARAQVILEREMDRLEEKAEQGPLGTSDANALKRLLQVAREVKAIELGFVPRGGGRAPQQLGGDQHGNGDTSRSPILEAIAESESEPRGTGFSLPDDD